MAEIVSKGQALSGQRQRMLEVVIVAIAGAAIVLAIGWAVLVSSSASVAPAGSTTQYLQEPGLLDQRRGERGVDVSSAGGTLFDPAFTEHRRGERSGR